jgi:hypothetical protein
MERFWSKVRPTGFCWEWTAATFTNGYGQFQMNGSPKLAHRVAYELLVGPIPEGLTLDHLCRVKHCVNPDHLDPVTQAENNARYPGVRTGGRDKQLMTHCKRGHEFTPENTGRQPNGRKTCRKCSRNRQRVYRAKERQNG